MRVGSDELMVSTYLDALPSPMPAYLHTHCLGLHTRQWMQWIPKTQLQQFSRTDRQKAIHMLRHARLPVMLKTELAAQLHAGYKCELEVLCDKHDGSAMGINAWNGRLVEFVCRAMRTFIV